MDNVSLLKNLYDAFGRGDISTVLALMSHEINWYEAESNPYMPSGEAWVGPDAVLNNLFMKLGADWDGFAVHPRTFRASDGAVTVEGRYSGTVKAGSYILNATTGDKERVGRIVRLLAAGAAEIRGIKPRFGIVGVEPLPDEVRSRMYARSKNR